MDKASLTLGWLVGRQIAGQRRIQEKQPIAYLYNGVQLPPLPEWDREMYPYAHIDFTDSHYFVYIFSQPPTTWKRTDYFPTTNTYEVNGMKSGIWNAAIHDPGQNIWYDFGEPNDNQYGWNKLTNIVWANYDVNSVDGTLFMAASEPIPIYSEPVNYLYNWVKLPKLPEWDKTVYPYAVMYGVKMSDGTWKTQGILEMYAEQPKVYSDDSGKTLCGVPNGCKAMYWGVCEPGTEYNSEWKTEANTVYERYTGRSISFYKVLWTNFDLLNEDGSVYLAASDPIPVYE